MCEILQLPVFCFIVHSKMPVRADQRLKIYNWFLSQEWAVFYIEGKQNCQSEMRKETHSCTKSSWHAEKWTEFNFVLFTALPANNHVFSLFSFMWNFCYCYSEGVWLLNCLNLCWKFILMYSFCAIILLAETVNVNIYKPQKNISAECLTNLTKTIMSSYK